MGRALRCGTLSKKEVDFLTTDHTVVPTFYLLPKVYKSLVNPPGTEEDCNQFIADLNNNPFNIKLTSNISRTSVEFLDLKLSLEGSYVVTTLYQKPTATNSLLHYSSFHPRHLKNGIPTGQFLRLKRNCSLMSDFQREAKKLTDRFRHRGYPKRIISSAYQRARTSSRSELLQRWTHLA
ncbi:uncharacterized protein LOC143803584 [Ranitomeya variabilis]|uniref:uncharacterized protein LOC143803584 n=1 Tax=Ranitomeya variabilis TaxID=490064 RepID=UPI0040571D61